MAKNANLRNAKSAKNDEFYTQLTDIEKEMAHHKEFFKDKVVYCNCDDARESNFFKYFSLNFEHLGLKKLICTGYKADGKGVVLTYEGDKNGNRKVDDEEVEVRELNGNGDFRSEECIEFLKECDVVVTNPPFSLFREYVAQLMEYGKKFIILGEQNAIACKEIFPYIKNNQLWWGESIHSGDRKFYVPSNYPLNASTCGIDENGKRFVNVKGIRWWTNVNATTAKEPLDLVKTYNEKDYPKYDNYDAIEVGKTADIPCDYDGVMGVPITFFDKYCPSQFELIGIDSTDFAEKIGIKPMGEEFIRRYRANGGTGHYTEGMRNLCYYENDGTPKKVYSRILIKKKVSE